MGCGGGLLAGWLAHQYPACQVIGFDSLPNLLAAAAETQQAPNLAFVTWNYANDLLASNHRCDVLVSCFGIDFPQWKGDLHPLDSATLRSGEFYDSRKHLMKSFFRCWRSAMKDGGRLFCVFRIPYDSAFLAVIDAAHEEGWAFEPAQSTKLYVGGESFPAIAFTARRARAIPEDDVLRHWIGTVTSGQDET